ncbi:hypothetical protein ACVWZA_000835 [Sphingomonas sp. UYAg733]
MVLAVCARMLWVAYSTHAIVIPLRGTGRAVLLGQEPGSFWASVEIYLFARICTPFLIATQISDVRFAKRLERRESAGCQR